MFIGTLIAVIGIGAFRAISAHGHPVPIVAPPHLPAATSMLRHKWKLSLPLSVSFCLCIHPFAQMDSSPHRTQMVTVEPSVQLEVLDWGWVVCH
jgi:hypothetical protein